jgi:hypothetical protein
VWGTTGQDGKRRVNCGLILEITPIAGKASVTITSWLRNRSAQESMFLFPGSTVSDLPHPGQKTDPSGMLFPHSAQNMGWEYHFVGSLSRCIKHRHWFRLAEDMELHNRLASDGNMQSVGVWLIIWEVCGFRFYADAVEQSSQSLGWFG